MCVARARDVDNPAGRGFAAKNIPPAFPGFARGYSGQFQDIRGIPRAIPATLLAGSRRTCYGSKQVA